jgi:hypothetical protein
VIFQGDWFFASLRINDVRVLLSSLKLEPPGGLREERLSLQAIRLIGIAVVRWRVTLVAP